MNEKFVYPGSVGNREINECKDMRWELVVDYLVLRDRLARVLSIVKSYYSWGKGYSVGVASKIIRQETPLLL